MYRHFDLGSSLSSIAVGPGHFRNTEFSYGYQNTPTPRHPDTPTQTPPPHTPKLSIDNNPLAPTDNLLCFCVLQPWDAQTPRSLPTVGSNGRGTRPWWAATTRATAGSSVVTPANGAASRPTVQQVRVTPA